MSILNIFKDFGLTTLPLEQEDNKFKSKTLKKKYNNKNIILSLPEIVDEIFLLLEKLEKKK